MLILLSAQLIVLASGRAQTVLPINAKLMEQPTFVLLEQNVSGIVQKQLNAHTMFAPLIPQIHHVHPMLNACGQLHLHHVQPMLALSNQTKQSVELSQHASGVEPTVSKTLVKFMLLILNVMLKPNASGMLQQNVRQMFAQTMLLKVHAPLM